MNKHKHTEKCNHEAELQNLSLHAQMISEQIDRVDSSIMELEYLKDCLDKIKETKKGEEILAPLSSGIFIKAKLEQNDSVLMNVGKEVVVEKKIPEAKKLLDSRSEELNSMREELVSKLQKIDERVVEIGEH